MGNIEQKKTHVKTAMRIPSDLHAEIVDAAERAGHSMNDEIVSRLSAGRGGASLFDIVAQNVRTQEMIQQILDAIGPRK